MGDPALNYEDSPDLDNESGNFGAENDASNDNTNNNELEIQNALAAEKAAEVAKRKQALQQQIIAGNNSAPTNDNQAIDNYKQRALAQIAQKKSKLEQELAELEKDLKDFKNGRALKILGFAFPAIGMKIDDIINQIKKRANKMSKESQIKFYETTIGTLNTLKAALSGLKLVSSFLDAAFIDNKSCLRLVLITLATIILPIILIIISPLYILFFGLLIYINKIPLVKGVITEQVCKFSDKVDDWIQNFKKKIDILQPEVRLQKQIAKLDQTAQQIQSGQISYRGRGAK